MLSRVVIVDAWNGGKSIADASQRHPAARTQNPFFQTKRQSEEVDSPQSIIHVYPCYKEFFCPASNIVCYVLIR